MGWQMAPALVFFAHKIHVEYLSIQSHIHHPIVVLPKILPQKGNDYWIYQPLGSLGYRQTEIGSRSWMYLEYAIQSKYFYLAHWVSGNRPFFSFLTWFFSFFLSFLYSEKHFSFFSLSRSAISCITSLLSQGGNLGCLTRLCFSGACLLITLRYTPTKLLQGQYNSGPK